MRIILAVTAAAWLLASPAVAQPAASAILYQALERVRANHGTGVRDYSLTVIHGDLRMPVYIRPRHDVQTERSRTTPMSEFLSMSIFWPQFDFPTTESMAGMVELSQPVYQRQEEIDGRPAHVLTLMPNPEEAKSGMKSSMFWIDAETLQIRRIDMIAIAPVLDEVTQAMLGDDARQVFTLDALDHAATDGVVLPRLIRLRARIETPSLTPEMRDSVSGYIEAMTSGPYSLQGAEIRALADVIRRMYSKDGMDLWMTIEDVRVNPGPPSWLDEPDS